MKVSKMVLYDFLNGKRTSALAALDENHNKKVNELINKYIDEEKIYEFMNEFDKYINDLKEKYGVSNFKLLISENYSFSNEKEFSLENICCRYKNSKDSMINHLNYLFKIASDPTHYLFQSTFNKINEKNKTAQEIIILIKKHKETLQRIDDEFNKIISVIKSFKTGKQGYDYLLNDLNMEDIKEYVSNLDDNVYLPSTNIDMNIIKTVQTITTLNKNND